MHTKETPQHLDERMKSIRARGSSGVQRYYAFVNSEKSYFVFTGTRWFLHCEYRRNALPALLAAPCRSDTLDQGCWSNVVSGCTFIRCTQYNRQAKRRKAANQAPPIPPLRQSCTFSSDPHGEGCSPAMQDPSFVTGGSPFGFCR
jgi:hypothetical protein